MKNLCRRPFRLDEISERADGAERGAAFFDVLDDDAVFLFEQHDEFERVNRVEAETGAEERRVVINLFGSDVLKFEGFDDLGFQFVR